MIRVHPYRWIALLGTLVVTAYVGLGFWLYHWQVVQHERFEKLSTGNVTTKAFRPARRGEIYDSRGTPLAVSIPVKTVFADPSLIFTQHVLVARTLAPLLKLPEAELLRKIQPVLRTNELGGILTNAYGRPITNAFVVLKHKVTIEEFDQITNAMARLELGLKPRHRLDSLAQAIDSLRSKSIQGIDGYLRRYPGGKLASHIVGYTSQGEVDPSRGQGFEDRGVTGLERRLDGALSGVNGWHSIQDQVAARSGMNVVLTLDAGLQNIVEEELAAGMQKFGPKSITAIVVRPATGEILALANTPAYDANEPGRTPDGYVNHAIQDQYEPGSTFKIVTIATALDDGIVSLTDRVNCENGLWRYAGRPLRDFHPHGVLTIEEVLAKSSNIGTAKTALRLGMGRLHKAMTNFGFGFSTSIPLPGEQSGVVYPTNHWDKLSITRFPIGHGVTTTPLQMVMAYAAIANGGMLMRPILLNRFEDAQGNVSLRFGPEAIRRVVSEATARQMVQALKAVASEEGTAKAAQLDYYTVAGKTGTAEKYLNGTYKSGRNYASFVGFFPADNPALCILVGVDEPTRPTNIKLTGGSTAAPIFHGIADRAANYLRVPPDLDPGTEEQPVRARPQPVQEVATRRTYADSAAADKTKVGR